MTAQQYRILAVDDDVENLTMLEMVLADDYEVLIVPGGAQALQLIQQQSIDVVLTDQRMPEMTGIQLLQQVKEYDPLIVRILLTGYSDRQDMLDAINCAEVYRYLTKPWDIEDLKFTVRSGLEQYQLRRDKELLLQELQQRLAAMEAALRHGYSPTEYTPHMVQLNELVLNTQQLLESMGAQALPSTVLQ